MIRYRCPDPECEHDIELPDNHRMTELQDALKAHWEAEHD